MFFVIMPFGFILPDDIAFITPLKLPFTHVAIPVFPHLTELMPQRYGSLLTSNGETEGGWLTPATRPIRAPNIKTPKSLTIARSFSCLRLHTEKSRAYTSQSACVCANNRLMMASVPRTVHWTIRSPLSWPVMVYQPPSTSYFFFLTTQLQGLLTNATDVPFS